MQYNGNKLLENQDYGFCQMQKLHLWNINGHKAEQATIFGYLGVCHWLEKDHHENAVATGQQSANTILKFFQSMGRY